MATRLNQASPARRYRVSARQDERVGNGGDREVDDGVTVARCALKTRRRVDTGIVPHPRGEGYRAVIREPSNQ